MSEVQERGRIIGIDLGVDSVSAAYLDAKGQIVPIPLDGQPRMPAVVFFEGKDRVRVGEPALQASRQWPERALWNVKEEMGQPRLNKAINGKRYSPQLATALILKKVKAQAEAQVGPIGGAVLTVPACSNELMRQATMVAAEMANLPLIDLVCDSTAAALAYTYPRLLKYGAVVESEEADASQRAQEPTLLVIHLGAGTCEASLLRVRGPLLNVLAVDGDLGLGGRQWDQRLAEHLAQVLQERQGANGQQAPQAGQELLALARQARGHLNEHERIGLNFKQDPTGEPVNITRAQFEELTSDLLYRAQRRLEQVLKEAGLTGPEMDHVVAVGEAAAMPQVQAMLKRVTGQLPDASMLQTQAVAQGAAVYGAILAVQRTAAGVAVTIAAGHTPDAVAEPGLWKPFEEEPMDVLFTIHVNNISAHTLGIVVRGPEGERLSVPLIRRHARLPVDIEKRFPTVVDNQKRVRVILVEGESHRAEECTPLGAWEIRLPPGLPKGSPIDVRVSYDNSQRLEMNVIEVTQLNSIKATVERDVVNKPEVVARAQQVLSGTAVQ